MPAIPGLGRARSWLFDIFAHHHAERLRTNRAVERQVRGVKDMDDYPYPGAIQGSGNPTTVVNQSGWLKGALVGAALLAGGAGAGLYALQQPPAPTVKTTTPAPVPPTAPAEAWDAIYEQQQPDGSWKQVKREPLKPGG